MDADRLFHRWSRLSRVAVTVFRKGHGLREPSDGFRPPRPVRHRGGAVPRGRAGPLTDATVEAVALYSTRSPGPPASPGPGSSRTAGPRALSRRDRRSSAGLPSLRRWAHRGRVPGGSVIGSRTRFSTGAPRPPARSRRRSTRARSPFARRSSSRGSIVPTIRTDVTHAESLRSSVTVAAELLGDLDVFARSGSIRARGPVEEARPPRTRGWNALRCRS
jgi:hypothetical protein